MTDTHADDAIASVTFDHDDDSVAVIIGSGAGGGTLGNELASKGIDVVILEAGQRRQLAEFVNDEYGGWDMFTWKDKRTCSGTAPFTKDFPEAPTWICKTVGGSTVHWVGNSFRFMEREFRPRSTYGEIPGANLIDWPISLEDMLPFYERAETKMGVTGRGDIPYLPPSNNFKVFELGAKRLGYQRITTSHLAINPEPYDGRNGCDQIGFCMQGCKSGAKWSTLYTEIPRAEATGRCEVRAECMALEIQHDDAGKITGVLYVDKNGAQHFQRARVVCVAGNAPETTRILLNSESAKYPDGLANSSGQLGKNFVRSVIGLVYGVFDKPVHMYRGPVGGGLIEDLSDHDPESRGFAGGIWLGLCSLGLPYLAAILKPKAWGAEYAQSLEAYDHMASLWFCGDDLPQERCAISVNKDVKDESGLPATHIHIDLHQNEIAMENWGFVKSTELFEAAGATKVLEEPPIACGHNLGTCRMSADPAEGVVNKWGQTHDIDNLFVSDGSQFTSNNTGNPTLTIVALAIRQAEYIAEQMRKNEF